jgi:malate dehydrogenase (oxaloacetate-decarboxylating)
VARGPIVHALVSPDLEVTPEDAAGAVRVMATRRGDDLSQISNALRVPGTFRGEDARRPVRAGDETTEPQPLSRGARVGVVQAPEHRPREDRHLLPRQQVLRHQIGVPPASPRRHGAHGK